MTARIPRMILSIMTLGLLLITGSGVFAAEPAPSYTDPATGMEFVLVAGNCYRMGNLQGGGSYTEYPAHDVCVDSFYIGRTEVTQGQWTKLMKDNPSTLKLGDDYPVESLSRDEAARFMALMAEQSGKAYRLPTEAEWEFACRSGGREETFCGGDDVKDLAWYQHNSGQQPHPVAQKKPNGLGLYDMSGSVWEFCSDLFAKDYYENSPRQNPQGAASGRHYIKRGGSLDINENFQRAATRARGGYDEKHYSTGFRVVFPAEP